MSYTLGYIELDNHHMIKWINHILDPVTTSTTTSEKLSLIRSVYIWITFVFGNSLRETVISKAF